jgi:hypothetical protein
MPNSAKERFMVSENKTLNKVYTAKNHQQLMDAYKEWATDYDSDTVDRFGYVAHIASAEALDKTLNGKNAAILDAGATAPGWSEKSWSGVATPPSMLLITRGKCLKKPDGKISIATISRPI